MNILDKINDIVNNNEVEYAMTGRELLHYLGFERRTVGVCAEVDRFLENKELMLEPHYNDVWIDSEIMLKHKPKAKTRLSQDPILKILEEATKTPVFNSRPSDFHVDFADNMEDKGIEKERAQQFQQTLIRTLEVIPHRLLSAHLHHLLHHPRTRPERLCR